MTRTARPRPPRPADRPSRPETPGRSILIGIGGGSGSGKTTVAESIHAAFEGHGVALISQDWYYRAEGPFPLTHSGAVNFDHPDSIDWDLLNGHVAELLAGRDIERPVYDFSTDSRLPQTVHVAAQPVILLEGIMALVDPTLRSRMNMKIFVDTDADVRFIRRMLRDTKERGRTVESVVAQYLDVVRLMHLEFIEPSKRHADLIVPEGGYNYVAVDLITTKVRTILEAGV